MKKLINDFIDYKNYRNNKYYLGCIFYGSYQTNEADLNSDIDIIFIFKRENFANKKGYKTFKNFDFEYFENDIDSLYKRIDKEIENRNDSFYTIIGQGEIIEDITGEIKKLQIFAQTQYDIKWNKIWNEEEIKYKIRSIYKSINDLQELINTNYYNIYYGIVLEKIRVVYHELNNLSRIGNSKVIKYYHKKNPEYFKLPNQQFISLYDRCVNSKCQTAKAKAILALYEFVNKYDFDMKFIEILLRGKDF